MYAVVKADGPLSTSSRTASNRGGAAWSTVSIQGVDTLPATQSKNGWVAGGGVEWKPWDDHWSIRAEYLYYRFSSVLLGAGFGGNLAISEGRIGAAYKF